MAEKKLNFNKSLDQLNTLVEELEQGDLPLDKALSQFEKGVKLIRDCQKTLNEAEQKVQMLVEKNGEESLIDFDPEEE